MAPFEVCRAMTHPYVNYYPDTHGHFAPTRFVLLRYSADCVPFRWILRANVEDNPQDCEIEIVERLQFG